MSLWSQTKHDLTICVLIGGRSLHASFGYDISGSTSLNSIAAQRNQLLESHAKSWKCAKRLDELFPRSDLLQQVGWPCSGWNKDCLNRQRGQTGNRPGHSRNEKSQMGCFSRHYWQRKTWSSFSNSVQHQVRVKRRKNWKTETQKNLRGCRHPWRLL